MRKRHQVRRHSTSTDGPRSVDRGPFVVRARLSSRAPSFDNRFAQAPSSMIGFWSIDSAIGVVMPARLF